MGNQCCENALNTVQNDNMSDQSKQENIQITVIKEDLPQLPSNIRDLTGNQKKLVKEVQLTKKPDLTEQIIQYLNKYKPFEQQIKFDSKVYKLDQNIYEGSLCPDVINFIDQKLQPSGYGRMFYPNGSLLVAFFQNGIPHGQGHFISPNGSYYQGKIFGKQANDDHAIYQCEYFRYQGSIKNNQFNGLGRIVGRDETFQFTGTFLNGKKRKGRLIWKQMAQKNLPMSSSRVQVQQEYEYNGQFDENQNFIGNASLKTPKGHYEGQFVNNKKQGIGIFYYSSGLKYEGQYKNDLHEGYGKIYSKNKKVIFEGEFHRGFPRKKGKILGESRYFHEEIWDQAIKSSKFQSSRRNYKE